LSTRVSKIPELKRTLTLGKPRSVTYLAREIIALKVPDLDERLRLQVARFVSALRKLELRKAPSIAETLDWARGLCALGVKELDPATVRQTLSLVVKHEDDLRKAEAKVGALLAGGGGSQVTQR